MRVCAQEICYDCKAVPESYRRFGSNMKYRQICSIVIENGIGILTFVFDDSQSTRKLLSSNKVKGQVKNSSADALMAENTKVRTDRDSCLENFV